MENKKSKSVAEKWCELLKEQGYEHHISKKRDCRKVKRFSRVWKTIFRNIELDKVSKGNLSVFEVGCGGGIQILAFALNDWECVGLDCSREVLERAKNYINETGKICGQKLDIKLICKDFLEFNPSEKFDLVFNVGVIEHCLDDNERMIFLKKMFELVKPGGYIISIVPNGIHPLRVKMRKFGLGGYIIPEIDYNPALVEQEFKKCGGRDIKILPYSLFGYFLLERKNFIFYLIKKSLYYIFQLTFVSILPLNFSYRHAATLIGIAKK